MEGSILCGSFDSTAHEFTITEVKHVPTKSPLSKEKAHSLYERINAKGANEDMMITINDGWPIFLSSEEVQLLKQDLQSILAQL